MSFAINGMCQIASLLCYNLCKAPGTSSCRVLPSCGCVQFMTIDRQLSFPAHSALELFVFGVLSWIIAQVVAVALNNMWCLVCSDGESPTLLKYLKDFLLCRSGLC